MPARRVRVSWARTTPPMSMAERERSVMSEPASSAEMAPRTTRSPSVWIVSWPSLSAALVDWMAAALPMAACCDVASVPVNTAVVSPIWRCTVITVPLRVAARVPVLSMARVSALASSSRVAPATASTL